MFKRLFKRLFKRFLRSMMLRRIKDQVRREFIAKANTGGLAFDDGDRVQAVNHRRVDDEGGYGVVLAARVIHPALDVPMVLVRFNSMPDFSLYYFACELQFDRREVA